jgi:hypothetical protein
MVKKKRLDNHTKRLVWSKLGGKKNLRKLSRILQIVVSKYRKVS